MLLPFGNERAELCLGTIYSRWNRYSLTLKSRLQEIAGDRLVKVVIYGSRARGDYDDASDTDIAVIVRELSWDLKNQMLERIADIEFEHIRSLSTLIISEEDFNLLKKRERRITLDIEREGIPL